MVSIITYLLVASIILFFEVLFPFGLWALFAFGFYALGVAQAWGSYGYIGGLIALAASVTLAALTLYLELRLLPKTLVGKAFFLKDKNTSHSGPEALSPEIKGKKGVAKTSLNPSGRVEVEGKVYEAQSTEGQIREGDDVLVEDIGPYGLKVKKA
jgi:membrane-bound serine protease (ClpP class)